MLELSIPQPGEGRRHTKDVIFTVLTQEQPLSLIEITRKIRREHNLGVTYQAVRKAADTLCVQGVLFKKDRRYSIRKEWVLKSKKFFDNLLTTYETGRNAHAFSKNLMKEDYAVYTFSNLFDLDNFWNDVIVHWADHLKKGDNNVFFSHYNYGFWFLINLGQETKLYEHVISRGGRPHMLALRDTPLNRWGVQLYKEAGAKVQFLARHFLDESSDLNLLGDTVLQVKYPPEITRKLRMVFRKYASTQEMSLREITQVAHEPGEIKLVLFKNALIAKSLREKYLPIF